MSPTIVNIAGRNYELKVKAHASDGRKRRFEVIVDGKPYAVDAVWQDAATSTLLIDGHSFDVSTSLNSTSGFLQINGEIFNCLFGNGTESGASTSHRPGTVRPLGSPRSGHAGLREIKASMPGKIVKVLVAPGEKVDHKQPLVVLEAMKMENEVFAPFAGTVKGVFVQSGERVEKGKKLVEMDL